MKNPEGAGGHASRTAIITLAFIGTVAVFCTEFGSLYRYTAATTRLSAIAGNVLFPALTPWQSVGGCGVGGGAGSGASVPWLGQGITGTIIDAEVRLSGSALTEVGGGSSTCQSTTLPLSLSFHPRFADIIVNMPLLLKQVQYGAQQSAVSAGFGDLHLTLNRTFGMEGQFAAIAGIGLATGKSDIHDLNHQLLPSTGQLGGGTFGGLLGANYTITRDWGTFLFGAGYSAGLFYLRSVETRFDTTLMRAVPTQRSFTWARTGPKRLVTIVNNQLDTSQMGFGAVNDMGVMTPDNIDCHAYVSMKAERNVHSFGLIGSVPTGNGKYDAITYPFGGPLLTDFPDKQSAQNFVDTAGSLYPDSGSVSYRVVGIDAGGDRWKIEQRSSQLQKSWPMVSVFYSLELGNERAPVFFSVAVPVEFNGDDGIGVKGFAADIGLKFPLY
jgi:hypothetical protein